LVGRAARRVALGEYIFAYAIADHRREHRAHAATMPLRPRAALLFLAACASGRRVLVTTFGGSGATGVMTALRSAGYTTNSLSNGDRLKFATLTKIGHEMNIQGGQVCMRKQKNKCFDRVIVIVREDPARAIVSVIAGQRRDVRPALARGCTNCPRNFPGSTIKANLASVFRHAGHAGRDGFGAANFLESWTKVSESHELMSTSTRYPPILVADVNTLASPDFQCFLYGYLEVRELQTQMKLTSALSTPQSMRRRPDPVTLMDPAARTVYDALRTSVGETLDRAHADAVRTFWNATKACRHRDLSSPLATTAAEPPATLKRPHGRPKTYHTTDGLPPPKKGASMKKPEPEIDPVALIPDDLWDATLFAILRGN